MQLAASCSNLAMTNSTYSSMPNFHRHSTQAHLVVFNEALVARDPVIAQAVASGFVLAARHLDLQQKQATY